MPNVIGYLRHRCPDQHPQWTVMGNVDPKQEVVGWGIMVPGGPDPSSFQFTYCPWCAEALPQLVSDWDRGSDISKRPIGFQRVSAVSDKEVTIE